MSYFSVVSYSTAVFCLLIGKLNVMEQLITLRLKELLVKGWARSVNWVISVSMLALSLQTKYTVWFCPKSSYSITGVF